MSKIFCGIADAHGLESFQQCSEIGAAPNTLGMRAAYNRQRHAMLYWVELHHEWQVTKMQEAIKQAQEDGNWHIPLLLLKDEDFCGEIAMEDEMKESWKLIPNDSLDPYWSMD
tara:strand:- start:1140 stop:1478 length:339 start_codon:yes stop_codon:yes gene_type:complete